MMENIVENIIPWAAVLVLYLLRDRYPIIRKIWHYFNIFLLVFFGTLMLNFLKERVKDWLKD